VYLNSDLRSDTGYSELTEEVSRCRRIQDTAARRNFAARSAIHESLGVVASATALPPRDREIGFRGSVARLARRSERVVA